MEPEEAKGMKENQVEPKEAKGTKGNQVEPKEAKEIQETQRGLRIKGDT